jgi:hypothetical protein
MGNKNIQIVEQYVSANGTKLAQRNKLDLSMEQNCRVGNKKYRTCGTKK